ncbi:MAG: 2-oxoacid:ferredoxin oxidoreductase subunit beta, partial [Gammaproteobacteria bacterium]|nr:2-oxoacid:ferredoxin oxidoreductase subunit beta [Gammaproteobacteria bacterium]
MDQIKSYKKKDFESDQNIRWCPGCGDYSILAQMQRVMPEIC